jgi:DNA-binding response OmpR family regulator
VDDAHEDLVFAQRVFQSNRIQNPIHLLSSGKACLDYFAANHGTPNLPCIVFLDVVMKPIGGIEVLRRLQKSAAAKGSIFIMLSGLTDVKKIAEGYKLGASTFFIKPLISAELMQMLPAVNGIAIQKTKMGNFLSVTGRRGASQVTGAFESPEQPSM